MPASFSRFMRSLDADRVHTSIAILFVIAALLGAWQSWFFLAQVELYELSNSARFRLIIHPNSASSIPLPDSFTGTAEVEIGRVSPAIVTLRAIGQLFVTSGTSLQSQNSSGASR